MALWSCVLHVIFESKDFRNVSSVYVLKTVKYTEFNIGYEFHIYNSTT